MADGHVFIVLEHPDMTYYGDAEVHGVYSSREVAEAHARQLDPAWGPDVWDSSTYRVEEWQVADKIVSDGNESVSTDN